MTSDFGMDDLCGSPFWDANLTWHTSRPRFTPCFERTALAWSPCFFLWLFAPLEACYALRSNDRLVPWNRLNVAKAASTGALIVLTLCDFDVAAGRPSELPRVEYLTPMIRCASFILTMIILIWNMNRGLRTSGLLFIFWLLAVIFGAPQFRSEIMNLANSDDSIGYSSVSYMLYYPLVLILFALNFFVDEPASSRFYPNVENPCPERNCSFPQRIIFNWFNSLAYLGYKRTLVEKDLWSLDPENTCSEVYAAFDKYWRKSENGARNSVVPVLLKAFWPTFLLGAFFKLIAETIVYFYPVILSLLIAYVETDDYVWKGYLYAGLLFIVATLKTLFENQYAMRMNIIGLRINTSLMSAIYRKSLRLSNSARKRFTTGETVNLMSIHAERFVDLMTQVNTCWSAPLQLSLTVYFLWRILGPSALAGLVVLVILIPITALITIRTEKLQTKQSENKDERVKILTEILCGIKVLKLYAWEQCFESLVSKIRQKETAVIKRFAIYNTSMSFLFVSTPFLVSLVTLATYTLTDPDNVLDSNKLFVTLVLFNIMKQSLVTLPYAISYFVQTRVSIKQLNTFLNARELDCDSINDKADEVLPAHSVIIEKASFSWEGDKATAFTLKNIDVKVRTGSLVAIVGPVGSGKSSLLSSLLGEMDQLKGGMVHTNGSVAYVQQQPWIQNRSFRDNIVFGRNDDTSWYNRVVSACALSPDVAALSGGDRAEIGERGANVSGGQKQRIALARAVYGRDDVYLLDDPLSAVDARVAQHIFQRVIGPKGLLKRKTRIFVTHNTTHLPQMDEILVMKNGKICESGTYVELLRRKGVFTKVMEQHWKEARVEKGKRRLCLGSPSPNGEGNSPTAANKVNRSPDAEVSSNDNYTLIEDEEAETGSIAWRTYFEYFKSFGVLLVFLSIMGNILLQAFSIGSNVWLSVWSSNQDLIGSNQSTGVGTHEYYLGVYTGLGIVQSLLAVAQDLSPQFGCIIAATLMHENLLRAVMRSPMSFFDATPIGRILSRFSKDTETMDWSLPCQVTNAFYCAFLVVGIVLVVSGSTPAFVPVALLIVLAYYFIRRFYMASSRQLKRLDAQSKSPVYSHLAESILGAATIRAYGLQHRFVAESEAKIDANRACAYPALISQLWLAVRLETVGNSIVLFAALFAVLGKESLSAGLVGLSVTYALQITENLNSTMQHFSELETDMVAVERVRAYCDLKSEAPLEIESINLHPDWPFKGKIEFQNVKMRYRPDADLVLRGISFTIHQGQKIGIVGRTGAGKSTLGLALFRLLEADSGRILIDGVDISRIGLHQLRSRMTIMPQDPVLFSGSLRMNLDPSEAYTNKQVWQAIEKAHLKGFVQGLGGGLHHDISEGGANLSVGQRQLVCLARALLRKTKILIMDEATAAVDLETDELIQRTIRREFASSTVLTITHRIITIMDSDRVMVLDKGEVVEYDRPDFLLEDSTSIFRGMAMDAGLASF